MRTTRFVRGWWLWAGMLVAGGALAQGGSAPPAGKLLITGSSTMRPMIMEMARRFESRNPGVSIEVQGGGSGRGIADARAGKADIGMASRALGEKEADLRGYPIARDGVCVIVNRANPVARLSDAQVRDIYVGRIANWKTLGGPDQPITVLERPADRSSHELFHDHFGLKGAAVKAARSVGDNVDLIRAVAEDPAAIGYVSVGEAERTAQAGGAIRLLPMGGVQASSRTILSGDFPVQRALTLVTRGARSGPARAFINFALSAQVSDIVRKHDFIPYHD